MNLNIYTFNDGLNVLSQSLYEAITGLLTFYPGVTEVKNAEKIEAIKKHPSYQALLDSGVHVEVKAKPAASKTTKDAPTETMDIAQMSAKDAIPIVQNTYAIPVLEDMHTREEDGKGRKSVLNAIIDQINEIKVVPEEEDE